MDLVAIAKGAGLAQSTWVEDEAHFEALVDLALEGPGPYFFASSAESVGDFRGFWPRLGTRQGYPRGCRPPL